MKEQWKRLDNDAKLLQNVEEGKSFPIKIEFPIGVLDSNKNNCCKKFIIFLRICILIILLGLLGSTCTALYARYYVDPELKYRTTPADHDFLLSVEGNKEAFRKKVYALDQSIDNIETVNEPNYKVSYDDSTSAYAAPPAQEFVPKSPDDLDETLSRLSQQWQEVNNKMEQLKQLAEINNRAIDEKLMRGVKEENFSSELEKFKDEEKSKLMFLDQLIGDFMLTRESNEGDIKLPSFANANNKRNWLETSENSDEVLKRLLDTMFVADTLESGINKNEPDTLYQNNGMILVSREDEKDDKSNNDNKKSDEEQVHTDNEQPMTSSEDYEYNVNKFLNEMNNEDNKSNEESVIVKEQSDNFSQEDPIISLVKDILNTDNVNENSNEKGTLEREDQSISDEDFYDIKEFLDAVYLTDEPSDEEKKSKELETNSNELHDNSDDADIVFSLLNEFTGLLTMDDIENNENEKSEEEQKITSEESEENEDPVEVETIIRDIFVPLVIEDNFSDENENFNSDQEISSLEKIQSSTEITSFDSEDHRLETTTEEPLTTEKEKLENNNEDQSRSSSDTSSFDSEKTSEYASDENTSELEQQQENNYENSVTEEKYLDEDENADYNTAIKIQSALNKDTHDKTEPEQPFSRLYPILLANYLKPIVGNEDEFIVWYFKNRNNPYYGFTQKDRLKAIVGAFLFDTDMNRYNILRSIVLKLTLDNYDYIQDIKGDQIFEDSTKRYIYNRIQSKNHLQTLLAMADFDSASMINSINQFEIDNLGLNFEEWQESEPKENIDDTEKTLTEILESADSEEEILSQIKETAKFDNLKKIFDESIADTSEDYSTYFEKDLIHAMRHIAVFDKEDQLETTEKTEDYDENYDFYS